MTNQPVQWQHIGELIIHIGVTREKRHVLWWHFIIQIFLTKSFFSSLLAALSARRGEVPEGSGRFEPRPKQPRILVWHSTGHRDHTQRKGNLLFKFFRSMFQPPGEDPDQHEREEDGDVWCVEFHQGHPHPHTLVWRRHWWTRWPPESSWSPSFNANFGCIVFLYCRSKLQNAIFCLNMIRHQYSSSGACQ